MADPEDTAVLEHVFLHSRHVGITYVYPAHCEAVPDDRGVSVSYLFMSTEQAADWLRMLVIDSNAAAVYASKWAVGRAK